MCWKNCVKLISNKAWEAYADNLPKFTMHSTIAGWVLAIASNVFGVSIDKKIDKKEKKYLIPREIGDGVSNILLFVGMTKLTTKLVNNLVDKGKIVTKELEKDVLKSGLGVGSSLLGAVIVSNVLAPIIRNTVAARSQKKFLEKQKNPTEQIVTPITAPTQNNKPSTNYMQTFLTAIHSGSLKV